MECQNDESYTFYSSIGNCLLHRVHAHSSKCPTKNLKNEFLIIYKKLNIFISLGHTFKIKARSPSGRRYSGVRPQIQKRLEATFLQSLMQHQETFHCSDPHEKRAWHQLDQAFIANMVPQFFNPANACLLGDSYAI